MSAIDIVPQALEVSLWVSDSLVFLGKEKDASMDGCYQLQ